MREEFLSVTLTKTEPSDSNISKTPRLQKSSRFKGVVPQQNGHWGAQIYANHHRIWLGTFKTEVAAATAYDSAAVKLRPSTTGDPHRNFPLSNITAREPEFQAPYTTDQVLNMIKDGSYQTKFGEFLTSISLAGASQTSPCNNNKGKKEGYFCQELFRKELTPSDVGKLNRLVIPKRYALKFFPKRESEIGSNIGKEVDDMELTFYDRAMKSWNFRYCYWKSSQSFVFTRGWNKFVKDKDLKAKDIVAFYMCEMRDNHGNNVNKFYMIDLVTCNPSQSHDHDIINVNNNINKDDDDDINNMVKMGEKIQEDKSFKLFGVKIC